MDYFDLAEFAFSKIGKLAGEQFIASYVLSAWFKKYTPNAYIDVEKMKIFGKKHGLERELSVDIEILEDKEYMLNHAICYYVY
jgi:hypothetical protein